MPCASRPIHLLQSLANLSLMAPLRLVLWYALVSEYRDRSVLLERSIDSGWKYGETVEPKIISVYSNRVIRLIFKVLQVDMGFIMIGLQVGVDIDLSVGQQGPQCAGCIRPSSYERSPDRAQDLFCIISLCKAHHDVGTSIRDCLVKHS
jgi:hypothetical protein